MDVKVVQKKKYKLITSYVEVVDGVQKKHRITNATKLWTKSGGLKKEAIKALAKAKGVEEADVIEQVKMNYKQGIKTSVQVTLSTLASSRVERFLGNFGIDINELVEDLQLECPEVDYAWVADESHWQVKGVYKIDGPLMLPDGRQVEFAWDYNEGALWQIVGSKDLTSEDVEDWT